MEPDGGDAICPRCGHRDDTGARQPLFVVTGASAAGKTTIYGPLAQRLAGTAVVFDVDWLLDAAGVLAGGAPLSELPWRGFDQAWLAVAHGVAQSGRPTVLCGTITPERVEANVGRPWIGPVHSLLLDCPDDVRRARIEARPGWRQHDPDQQIRFAQWLRASVPDHLDTSRGSPDDAARAVATWVEAHLEPHFP